MNNTQEKKYTDLERIQSREGVYNTYNNFFANQLKNDVFPILMGEITKAMQIFETVHLPKSKVLIHFTSQKRGAVQRLLIWEDVDGKKQLVTCSCQFIFQSFKTLKSLVCFDQIRRGYSKLDWKKLTNTLTTSHYSSTFNQSILYLRGMLLGFMISIIHHLLSNLLLLCDQSSRHKRMRRSRKTISKCLCESYYF